MNQPPPQVLILGLNTFARKNVVQVRSLEAEGYAFTVVTNDQAGDSRAIFDSQAFARSRLVIPRGLREKLLIPWRLLRSVRFHHVELSPAGRMALAYLLMLKVLRVPFIVIERGDIGCLDRYGFFIRLALRIAYRWADLVIFKEPYMEAPLRRLTAAPLHFVPNCVDRAEPSPGDGRDIDFLWVNRLIPEREIGWVTGPMGEAPLRGRKLVILGAAQGDEAITPRDAEISVLGFIEPTPYYRRARFFCLPASIVFGNNALLEAMSFGVVPVVTDAPGIGRLLEDGVNGIVTRFDEAAYSEGLARAAALGDAEWAAMSRRAVETVREKYSVEAWTSSMADVYARVRAA